MIAGAALVYSYPRLGLSFSRSLSTAADETVSNLHPWVIARHQSGSLFAARVLPFVRGALLFVLRINLRIFKVYRRQNRPRWDRFRP